MPRGSTPYLEFGLQGRAALDLVGHMEGASLYVRAGPHLPYRREERRDAADRRPGSGDVQHQRRPGGPAHALRQVPADDVAAPHGDQHDGLPAKPYAVQEHDVVNLAAARHYRLYPPGPHCLVPKRRSAGLQIHYRVL